MTTPLIYGSEEYLKLRERYTELCTLHMNGEPTIAESHELGNLNTRLGAAERAFDAAAAARSEATSVFADVCEDYEETMRWAGSVE